MKEQERRGEIRKKVKNGERRRIQIKLTREIMPKKKHGESMIILKKRKNYFFSKTKKEGIKQDK